MKPTKIDEGWYELPGWEIVRERKGYNDCPKSGWWCHPKYGSPICTSQGPFRTMKEAVAAVEDGND